MRVRLFDTAAAALWMGCRRLLCATPGRGFFASACAARTGWPTTRRDRARPDALQTNPRHL